MIELKLEDYGLRFTNGRYKLLRFNYEKKYVILKDNSTDTEYKAIYNAETNLMNLEELQ